MRPQSDEAAGSGGGAAAGGGAGKADGKVRYAVVGLGHIAQVAVLPAFRHAGKNSELTALVSDDPTKLEKLGKKYGVERLYGYEDYERCLMGGEVDAVYIATPNSKHAEFAVRAAEAGVHVLCEKPLGVTSREALEMIRACEEHGVHLMTAYRLHFEAANLEAVRIAKTKKLGELRLFNSTFTMRVKDPDNIRLRAAEGMGPLHDIGIYCINAARSLFQTEPTEAFAWATRSPDPLFEEVPDSMSCVLRFPKGRLASFVISFGAADVSSYELIGTRGSIRLDPAYDYSEGLEYTVKVGEKEQKKTAPKRDQFAAELLYFSECVLKNRSPEPSGYEGLADLRVIEAIEESVYRGGPVPVMRAEGVRHPQPEQRIDRPPVRKPETVHATGPRGDE